ncbi:cytosolic carboxypeptidase 6-like [Amphibalanus amphitrite]|uniref:cytosolic carboxypeptidase 6-like n=1 Tax=Amphibalanus amphitrite TaxID=1232801 RepID=UPI001C92002D|nr:cytosolic carboxypeptidase 6-like [Amphibalanus amphitrite]
MSGCLMCYDPLEHTNMFSRREDSEDSDNEGGMGNVNRAVMRPPGHSGKAKRGHLCFDASFETGNLGRVDYISEFEYDLFIRPDACNPRYRIWFNFVVDNVRQDQRVIFNIVNMSKTKNLFRDGMTPLVKSTSRNRWQRLPARNVYYHRSAEHRGHYILSFAFAFDREEDVYQFSGCFPYSFSRLQLYLAEVERLQLPWIRRQTLTLTVQKRECDLVTVGPPEAMDGHLPTKTVVIMARVHPGETPTSFIIKGLLDLLTADHPVPSQLRQHIVIKIIPMLNPDGVFLGNHRCSVMGADLNRAWQEPSEWGHPTIHAARKLLHSLDTNKNNGLEIVLDLHAHTSLLGCFVYGTTYEDVYRHERHIVFPKMMSQNSEDFSHTNTIYNRDPLKLGTARRYLCSQLSDSVNCYSLVVSMYGYTGRHSEGVIPYTEEAYMRLGRDLGRALLDYFRAMQVFPSSPKSAAAPAAGAERPPRAHKPPGSVTSAPAGGAAPPPPPPPDPELQRYPLTDSGASSVRGESPRTPAIDVRVRERRERAVGPAAPPGRRRPAVVSVRSYVADDRTAGSSDDSAGSGDSAESETTDSEAAAAAADSPQTGPAARQPLRRLAIKSDVTYSRLGARPHRRRTQTAGKSAEKQGLGKPG